MNFNKECQYLNAKIDDIFCKISDDEYCICWFNLMHFEMPESYKSFSNYEFVTKQYEYEKYNKHNKYNKNKHIEQDKQDKQDKILVHPSNIFPYNPLNIDISRGYIFKENDDWILLTMNNFHTNVVMRCQQGSLNKYTIKIAHNKLKYDLILFPEIFSSEKVSCDVEKYVFDKYYNKYIEMENKYKIIKSDKLNKSNYLNKIDILNPNANINLDPILKILFQKKLHFYRYDDIKLSKLNKYFFGVKLIEFDILPNNDNNNLVLKIIWNDKEYLYEKVYYDGCCGHGEFGTFISIFTNHQNF